MDSRQLTYLRAVLDHGSFTAASKALFLTQPSLSTAIRNLERELGTQLLIRSRSGVTATEAGRELYRLATDVLEQMESARNKIIDVGAGATGHITLNVAPEYNWVHLPALLRTIRATLPNVELTVADPEPVVTLGNIKSGRADIGIMPTSDIPRLRDTHPELSFDTLVTLPLGLGLPPEHPANAASTTAGMRVAEVRNDDWLVPTLHPEFPGLPESLQRFWALQPKARPLRIHQVATLQTALPLIAGGVGVAVLPEFAAGMMRNAIVYRPVLDDIPPLYLVMLWRRQPHLSPVVERVLDLTREHATTTG